MPNKPPANPVPTLNRALSHETSYMRSRAQIVLLTLEGQPVEAIAEEAGVSERTVQKWQRAWEEEELHIFPEELWVIEDATRPVASQPDGSNGGKHATDVEQTITIETPATPAPDSVAAIKAAAEPEETEEAHRGPRLDVEELKAPGVLPEDSLAEAGRKILRFHFNRMILQEPIAYVGEDISGVHQMRVATRRMRSTYDVFGDHLNKAYYKHIPRALKLTARRLGSVRDIDVFLLKTHEDYVVPELDGDGQPLKPLLKALKKQHKAARKRLVKWLDGKEFKKFIKRFDKLLDKPTDEPDYAGHQPIPFRVDQIVPRLVYTRLETIRSYEPLLAEADAETLHALRIDFKRLRYTLEFFQEVLGEEIKLVINEVKQMQDHLGDLNDAVVAVALIEDIEEDVPVKQRAGLVAYREFRQAEAERLVATFPEAWASFDRHEIREALAMAIATL